MRTQYSIQPPLPDMPPGNFGYGNIMTPRADIAERDSSIIVEPIFESEPYKTAVAAYEATDKTFSDKIGVASDIATVVRKSLQYETHAKSKVLLRPENLAADSRTNCYGYSLVMSEALERAGIGHNITFANGHSFITICDEASGQISMVDSVTRKFDGIITDAFVGTIPSEQLKDGARFATNGINTQKMLEMRGLQHRTDELARESPWVSYYNPDAPGSQSQTRERYDHSFVLQARTFDSKTGRQVLQNLSDAVIYLNIGDLNASSEAFERLDGVFPDVDSRGKLALPRRARTAFLENGRYGNALVLAGVIEHSLDPSDRSRNKTFEPDTYRKIGNIVAQEQLLLVAAEQYRALPVGRSLSGGKIRATELQLARVQKINS